MRGVVVTMYWWWWTRTSASGIRTATTWRIETVAAGVPTTALARKGAIPAAFVVSPWVSLGRRHEFSLLHRNKDDTQEMEASSSSSQYEARPLKPNGGVHHAPGVPPAMAPERTCILTSKTHQVPKNRGKVVWYWMHRDVRTVDNWALLYATHLAQTHQVPLRVLHCLSPPPPLEEEDSELAPSMTEQRMTQRHGQFLLGGLQRVQEELQAQGVPLQVVTPASLDSVGEELWEVVQEACAVVCDFSPLRRPRQWMEQELAPRLDAAQIPLYQVDAHNVVPVWEASPHREVAARTFRPKVTKLLSVFLTDHPEWKVPHRNYLAPEETNTTLDWKALEAYLQLDDSVPPVEGFVPGTAAGLRQFDTFCAQGLAVFDAQRNDPTQRHVCSSLSPWINHGHVSFQRLAWEVQQLKKSQASLAAGVATYLEEGLVRRELSDNFCYYEPHYDSLQAAAHWAYETLELHSSDARSVVYTWKEWEAAQTHDALWNAAQLQAVEEGKIHGYLRMYWAKKLLEWTASPEAALRCALYLNDKYTLDGSDPNGFVGVGWSIMGIHDQGWKEREVFGKIRYMNHAGCCRKFNVSAYVSRFPAAAMQAQQVARRRGMPLEGAKEKKATSRKRTTPAAGNATTKKLEKLGFDKKKTKTSQSRRKL